VSVSVFDVGIGIRYFAIVYNGLTRPQAHSNARGQLSCARRPINHITSDTVISCEIRNAGATCLVFCQVSISDNNSRLDHITGHHSSAHQFRG